MHETNAKSAIFTCENGKRLLRSCLLLLPDRPGTRIAMCVFSGVARADEITSFQQGLGRMLGLQTERSIIDLQPHRSRDFYLRESFPLGPRLPLSSVSASGRC